MKKLQVPYNNFVKEQARACRIKCYKYLDSSFNINIIDNRFSFYCNNLDLLPKPKLTFEDLKKGVQDFHRMFDLASADKTVNNIEVVWQVYYIKHPKSRI